jgi:hypothetical protein
MTCTPGRAGGGERQPLALRHDLPHRRAAGPRRAGAAALSALRRARQRDGESAAVRQERRLCSGTHACLASEFASSLSWALSEPAMGLPEDLQQHQDLRASDLSQKRSAGCLF